jgi:hypothetical protein
MRRVYSRTENGKAHSRQRLRYAIRLLFSCASGSVFKLLFLE